MLTNFVLTNKPFEINLIDHFVLFCKLGQAENFSVLKMGHVNYEHHCNSFSYKCQDLKKTLHSQHIQEGQMDICGF